MTPEQKELFREALLRVLDGNASRRYGLNVRALAAMVRPEGFDVKPDQVQREIDYMAGEPHVFVEQVDKKEFSPENQAWRLTTRGMNFLAERGF